MISVNCAEHCPVAKKCDRLQKHLETEAVSVSSRKSTPETQAKLRSIDRRLDEVDVVSEVQKGAEQSCDGPVPGKEGRNQERRLGLRVGISYLIGRRYQADLLAAELISLEQRNRTGAGSVCASEAVDAALIVDMAVREENVPML